MYQCNPGDWEKAVKKNEETLTPDEFVTWFEGGKNRIEAGDKGGDIFYRLILPHAKKYLDDLSDKTCLDIGYGNGSLAVTATEYFEQVFGIDWHDSSGYLYRNFLDGYLEVNTGIRPERGKLHLAHSPDSFSIESDSIDFVYSWLFVNRLGTIANVVEFLNEIHRVMRDPAAGVIFFPRYIRSSRRQSLKEYEKDIMVEKQDPTGYREGGSSTRIKGISIVISMWVMRSLLDQAGFKVVGQTASHDGKGKSRVYHGQHGLVFTKGEFRKETKRKASKKTSMLKRGKEEK